MYSTDQAGERARMTQRWRVPEVAIPIPVREFTSEPLSTTTGVPDSDPNDDANISPDAMIATAIEEEHRWLTIKGGQVWTVGDLALHDQDVFRGLDCLLSIEAYLRVVARR